MKKIILLLSFVLILFSCKKEEIYTTHKFDYVTIELTGSVPINYVYISDYEYEIIYEDEINYTFIYNVNGIQNQVEINKVIDAPFTGTVYSNTIKLFEDDDFNLTIINNKQNNSYIYVNLYTLEYRKVRLNVDTFFQSNVKIENNKFRDVILY